jgi:nucleoid-associated protein YgaU
MEHNRDNRNADPNPAPYNEQVNSGQAGGIITEYIVEEKDTLADIANRYGVSIDEIMAANSETIHQPSDLIQPGLKIMIPKPLR